MEYLKYIFAIDNNNNIKLNGDDTNWTQFLHSILLINKIITSLI